MADLHYGKSYAGNTCYCAYVHGKLLEYTVVAGEQGDAAAVANAFNRTLKEQNMKEVVFVPVKHRRLITKAILRYRAGYDDMKLKE